MYSKVHRHGKRVVHQIRTKDTWFHRVDRRYMVSGWVSAFAVCAFSGIALDKIIGPFLPGLLETAIHMVGCVGVFYVYDRHGWIKT